MNIFEKNNITKPEFETKEISALKQMVRPYEDIFDASSLLVKANPGKYIEIDLILAFVLVDTCSRYFEILENSSGNSEKRFRNWVDTFVLNEKNPIYKEKRDDMNYGSEAVWQLRCSLVHFYGLPRPLPSGDRIILNWGYFNKNITEEFKKKGIGVIVVNYEHLRRAIHNSLKPWESYLQNLVENKPEIYLPQMLKVFEVTEREGITKLSKE